MSAHRYEDSLGNRYGYRVGDRVLVRSDLCPNTAYGSPYNYDESWWTNDMQNRFAGRVVTISNCFDPGWYEIEEDPDYVGCFADEMFVGLADEVDDAEDCKYDGDEALLFSIIEG